MKHLGCVCISHIYMRYVEFFFSSPAKTINLISCCVWSMLFGITPKALFTFCLVFFRVCHTFFFSFHSSCSFIRYRCSIKVYHIIFCLLNHCVLLFLFQGAPVQTKSIFSLWNILFLVCMLTFKVLHI